MKHLWLELPLKGQLFHLTNGAIGSMNTGTVSIEIEHDALAIAAAAQLGDLLTAQGRAQGRHGIGHASGMQGDHIEVTPTTTARSSLRIADAARSGRTGACPSQRPRFRGVEVLGFGAVKAAAAETDHPTLTVLDRHHHRCLKRS